MGGTFDQIHRGHRELLNRAFETADFVYIGLTSDDFVARAGKKVKNDFERRKIQLQIFLDNSYPGREYEITRLDNRFGPGIFTKDIDALVVSAETLPMVESANAKRRKEGLPNLRVEVVPLVMAKDGNRISSTRIRAGEIDTEGNRLTQ